MHPDYSPPTFSIDNCLPSLPPAEDSSSIDWVSTPSSVEAVLSPLSINSTFSLSPSGVRVPDELSEVDSDTVVKKETRARPLHVEALPLLDSDDGDDVSSVVEAGLRRSNRVWSNLELASSPVDEWRDPCWDRSSCPPPPPPTQATSRETSGDEDVVSSETETETLLSKKND